MDLAQTIDWYIIPVFNVDGYHYTHETVIFSFVLSSCLCSVYTVHFLQNRLWRKTRQNHATICFGTDANRNFDFQWLGKIVTKKYLDLIHKKLLHDSIQKHFILFFKLMTGHPRVPVQRLMPGQTHFPNRKLQLFAIFLNQLAIK